MQGRRLDSFRNSPRPLHLLAVSAFCGLPMITQATTNKKLAAHASHSKSFSTNSLRQIDQC